MNFRAHAFVAATLRLSAVVGLLLLVVGCGDAERIAELEAEKKFSKENVAHLDESWMEVSDQLVAKTAELNRVRRESEMAVAKVQSFREEMQARVVALEEKTEQRAAKIAELKSVLVRFHAERKQSKQMPEQQTKALGGEATKSPAICGWSVLYELPRTIAEEEDQLVADRVRLLEWKKTVQRLQAIEDSAPSSVEQSGGG